MSDIIVLSIDDHLAGQLNAVERRGVDFSKASQIVLYDKNDSQDWSFRCGFLATTDLYLWLQSSIRRTFIRRSLKIITPNSRDRVKTMEIELHNALLTQFVFPTLEKGSKTLGELKIHLSAEGTVIRDSSLPMKSSPAAQPWPTSAFRFTIDGMDRECTDVTKVESLSFKVGIKRVYSGSDRFPQIEPSKVEFPNVVVSLPARFSEGFLSWHELSFTKNNRPIRDIVKTGSIEFLSPNSKSILRINLFELGIQSVSKAGGMVNVSMYCGRMDIDGDGRLGLE